VETHVGLSCTKCFLSSSDFGQNWSVTKRSGVIFNISVHHISNDNSDTLYKNKMQTSVSTTSQSLASYRSYESIVHKIHYANTCICGH
jgi:hypothetical protein